MPCCQFVLFGLHFKNRNSRENTVEASKCFRNLKRFQKPHLLGYNLAFSLCWLCVGPVFPSLIIHKLLYVWYLKVNLEDQFELKFPGRALNSHKQLQLFTLDLLLLKVNKIVFTNTYKLKNNYSTFQKELRELKASLWPFVSVLKRNDLVS